MNIILIIWSITNLILAFVIWNTFSTVRKAISLATETKEKVGLAWKIIRKIGSWRSSKALEASSNCSLACKERK